MSKFRTIQNSLNGGEISPRALARSDLEIYPHCCKTVKNFILLKEGGATFRPGTVLIDKTKGTGTSFVHTVPFKTNASTATNPRVSYQVELSSTTIRVITIDRNTKGTVYTVGSGITRTAGFEGVYWPSASPPHYAQIGNILYLVGSAAKPSRLIWNGSATAPAFVFETFDAKYSGPGLDNLGILGYVGQWPFRAANVAADSFMHFAGAAGVVGDTGTLEATGAGKFVFTAGHIGAVFKLTDGAVTGAVRVTDFTDADTVICKVENDCTHVLIGNKTTDWEESAWSIERGWPKSITIHRGRIAFGSNKAQPETTWGTAVGNVAWLMAERFAQDASGVLAADPFVYAPGTEDLNEIQWMASGKNIFIGTSNGEYVTDPNIGPSNPGITRETPHGSALGLPGIRSGYTTIFVDRDARKILELAFNHTHESYRTTELSILCEHFAKEIDADPNPNYPTPRIVQIAWQETPNPVLWFITNHGNLYGILRDKINNTAAGFRVEIAGTTAKVINLSINRSSFDDQDVLYMVVHRTIDSASVYTVEVMATEFLPNALNAHIGWAANAIYHLPVYMDATVKQYDAAAKTTWGNFTHLKGEEAAVYADGWFVGYKTVSAAGEIELDTAANIVAAGLPYTGVIEPVKQEGGSAIGTAFGAKSAIHRIVLMLYRTIGGKYGQDLASVGPIPHRDSGDAMDETPPMFTGDKELDFEGDYDISKTLFIVQDQPLPMTVLGVVTEGMVND